MKIKNIILSNLIVIIYFILSIMIEIIGVLFTDGGLYIRDPRYMFTILGIGVFILLLISNMKARTICAFSFIFVEVLFNIFFKLLFDMSGQWFDYSMFNLRSDAMGILESIPVNFWFFYICLFILSLFLVFGIKYSSKLKQYKMELSDRVKNIKNAILACLIVLMVILNIVTGYSINGGYKDKYKELFYSSSSSKYNEYGMTSNFINELYKGGLYDSVETKTNDEMYNFFYGEVYQGTEGYFGISSGNNVVSILGETFEWLSFMPDGYSFCYDEDSILSLNFPNGLKLSEDELRELYPNLWRFYDNSYVMTNYHAREKTDISENYSILGSYPVSGYINYDYYENILPQSMPNTLRTFYGTDNFVSKYFHNGNEDFYNRNQSIYGLGFDEFYGAETMESDYGMTSYLDDGERNCDSDMISAMANEMFPTDTKFYTSITTISMHGMFSKKRNCLEQRGYYDVLREYGLDIDSEDISEEDFIYYSYLACALETDKAIGIVLDELEQRGLLENTTIVLFGDHQAYYDGLTNYVKNISSENQALEDGYNYLDLYRVPMMIYDTKLYNYVTNNGLNPNARFNSKFSSSCDIVPTLLDLLGIKYYSNMYYGNSVFSSNVSLIYSRGYGYFLDEYSYFYNITSFTYVNPIVDELYYSFNDYKELLSNRGDILIEKIRYTDIAFKTDYFGTVKNYERFKTNLRSINN